MSDEAWRESIYEELRAMAAAKMARESPGATLSPTALVHEAYVRLMGAASPPVATGGRFTDRSHFFAAAASAMRRILVDRARRRDARKRGGDQLRANLDPDQIAAPERSDDLLALDEALEKLAAKDARKAQLVELHFFAGLTLVQAAETLGISPATADRDWAYARAWLFRNLQNP